MLESSRAWCFDKLSALTAENGKRPVFSLSEADLAGIAGRLLAGDPAISGLSSEMAALWRSLLSGETAAGEAETLVRLARQRGVPIVSLICAQMRFVEDCLRQTPAPRSASPATGRPMAAIVAERATAAVMAALDALSTPEPEPATAAPPPVDGRLPKICATLSVLIDDAKGTAEKASALSGEAALAAMNVRMVSGMMGEIRHGVAEVQDRVVASQEQAATAKADAEKANQKIAELSATVGQIASVAKLIKEIAHRTNLLAMNATIEAARAGEAGRGFAVVAGEVKTLANQTAKATEEIDQRLAIIRDATAEVVQVVSNTTASFGSIHSQVEGIAASVSDEGGSFNTIQSTIEEAANEVDAIAAALDGLATTAGSALDGLSGIRAGLDETVH